jgi:histidine triad (HIT) family protein
MIVRDESPNYRICEDDKSVAILDLYPVNPGHILVLPKRHVETLAELEEDELTSMTLMLQKLVRAVDKALAPDGLNMMINQGEAAGQVVPHFHWHIIPRYTGDRLVIRSTRLRPSAEEFREVQAWLRENL